MAIILRSSKDSALTFAEMDGNITDLDTRINAIDSAFIKAVAGTDSANVIKVVQGTVDSAYVRSKVTTDQNLGKSDSVVFSSLQVTGDLVVNGTTTTLSSNTLTLDAAPASGEEVVVHIVGDVISGQALVRNNFTGDGSTTAFTLTLAPMNENNTFVYFDGVYQEKSEYSVSGTTLTFTSAPANGDSIEVIIPKATEINQPATGSIDDAAM